MSLNVRSITFDCANPALLAEFWTAALGYDLKAIDEEGALVVDPKGVATRLLFIVVPEGKAVKNRVHLDLQPSTTMNEEVERLVRLGGTVMAVVGENGGGWTVMQDPEGNEFCVERNPNEKRTTVPAS